MSLTLSRHVAAVRKIARLKAPRRRKVIPRQLFPRRIEADYANSIAELTARAARVALEPLLRELPQLLDSAKRSRVDTVEHRMDAGEGRRARQLVDQARSRIESIASTGKIEDLGRKFARQTSSVQRMALNRQVRAALGVDVVLRDRGMAAKIEHFAAENVSLIRSMQTRLHDEVERIVTRAVVEGQLHSSVAAQIEERFGVSENHARLIARDQIGKLYGQINSGRQQDLGVTHFIWRTVGDERVREEHAELDGETFPYDDPPNGELPGQAIQCRCSAEPVFSTILAE